VSNENKVDMSSISTLMVRILEFALCLGVLIFLHELGHFLTSRLFKIEVEEFGFGFPPRLARLFRLGNTQFTLNWIPFGAFVRPKGENDPNIPGGLAAASPLQRLVVLASGPLMNFVAGILLLSMIFIQVGGPDLTKVQVIQVNNDSPAALAGITEGDLITHINGEPITSIEKLSQLVQNHKGQSIVITLLRNGQKIDVQAIPRINPPEDQGALGIVMSNPIVPLSLGESVIYGSRVMVEQCRQLILLPSRLIRGQLAPEQARVVGPVGIFGIYNQVRERDIEDQANAQPSASSPKALNTLYLLASISIALGFANLLPIPALDGGRILFVLVELAIRRRIPPEYENAVHSIGFLILISLMLYVTVQDIVYPIVLP